MRWKFVSLTSGWDLQIVTTAEERDRFIQYCKKEGIRYGLVRVDGDGVYTDLPACASCTHARSGVR